MGETAEQGRTVRIRSATWLFTAQVGSLALSIPLSVLLARVLGPEGKGTLSVVQQVATLGALLFGFGFAQGLTYYGARREIAGRDVVTFAVTIAASAAVIVVGGFLVGGRWLSELLLHSSDTGATILGALTIGPVLAAQMAGAFVIGSGSIRSASLVNVGSLAFQLVLCGALWTGGFLSVDSALAVWVVAVIGAMVAQFRLSFRASVPRNVDRGARALFHRIRGYSLTAWPGTILGNAALRIDVFLLSALRNPAEVGIYSIAVTLAELCWYVPNSLGGVLVPKVAAEGESSRDATMRICRVTWLVTLLLGIGVFLVAIPAVPLVFGREFAPALRPLVWILPGIVAMAFASAPSSYLSGIGYPGDWTKAAGFNLLVNIVANVVLIPKFGATGAAAASSISYAFAAGLVAVFFVRRTGESFSRLIVPTGEDFRIVAFAARSAVRSRLS